jgi:dTDP-4-dehydrorhamnose reductase
MKKIVITGSNGLLGQSLLKLLLKEKNKYEVFGFSKGENRSGRTDFSYVSIDITNEKNLKKALIKIQPDAIVNTAAMTQVDDCEIHKEACDVLNIDVVKWLKEASEIINCHLIHLSTDFIFDGEKGYYKETDMPNPLSYYGMSKVKSEEILLNSTIDFTIIRTILVYGKVYDMSRTNIVLWVKEILENGKEITIVDDQFRMPTFVDDLALSCKLAIDKKATGIFHISSTKLMSVFEIVHEVANVFGLDSKLIKPTSSNILNQKAKRPPKTGFDVSKAITVLGIKLQTFEEDLQRFKDILVKN